MHRAGGELVTMGEQDRGRWDRSAIVRGRAALRRAGELGHVTVLPDGPVCGCGNNGCLHTLASESAIMNA